MLTFAVGESVEDRPMRASAAPVRPFAAIVLAGSHTWRRTPFDRLLPRPLLPVAQFPLLSYPLRWLGAAGAARATICTNGLTPQLRPYLEPLRDVLPALEFFDDETPRGAAGSARDAALATDAEVFVVADATTIPAVDLQRVLAEHERSRAVLTIIVQPRESGSDSLIPTGLYVFSRRAFDFVPATGYQDIKESLIPRLYAAGELVLTSESDEPCPQVLDAKTYLAVNHRLIARTERTIHPSARIHPSALLVGPVMVGAGAEIGERAVIVGPASIGAGTTIEAGAVISRSVIWAECSVGAQARVHCSVVSAAIRVAARTRLVGAIEASTRPAKPWKTPSAVPVRPLEPAVNARSLAFH